MDALAVRLGLDRADYAQLAEKVKTSFAQFWMEDKRCLRDVISGTSADEQIRCNQIWAVTQPFTMLTPEQERAVVDVVYTHLYTPCGLRTLSPADEQYHGIYAGVQKERDMAYHQGTTWVFPLGAYYLAYLKVHGYTEAAKASVREALLPMEAALREVLDRVPGILSEPEPFVAVSSYGESAIQYVVRAWTSTDDYWDVYFAITEQIRPAFLKHGIEMTYNHLNIHVVEKV